MSFTRPTGRWSRRLRRRARDDRGVSAVEFALLAPVLVLLLAGIADLGLLLQTTRTTADALHSAARQGARAGENTFADQAILRAVQARMGANDDIGAVVIYRAAAGSTGKPPPGCMPVAGQMTPSGVSGLCNIYPGAFLDDPLDASDFDDSECDTGEVDAFWCPADRGDAYDAGDRLGVWMSVNYKGTIGLVINQLTVDRHAVFRLEIE